MEALVPGEKVRKLPCGHIYHAGCIDEWLIKEQLGDKTLGT